MSYPGFGPQKIEMNKRTGSAMPSEDYKAMMNSLLREEEFRGAGMKMISDRNPKYGNVNTPGMTQGVMQGEESMALQNDSFNNAPLAKPTAQTGQLGYFSATQEPQKQPELMGEEAEQGIKQRMLGEYGGLNNRQQLYRA